MKTDPRHKLPILLLVMAVLISSCVSMKNVKILQDNTQAGPASFSHGQKPVYQLKSGDHLYIKVFSVDPKTSRYFQSDFPNLMNSSYIYLNSYPVDEEGYLHFSFIDKMMVRGLTIEDVKKKLQETLNEYFTEATIIVKLVNFRVSVLGEVKSPGTYTIDKDQVDIFQALGEAGGLTTFGNIRKVTLVRQTNEGSDVHYLDLSRKDILASEFFYLMPDDVLYVEPRNSKPFVLETLPYGTLVSTFALVLSVLAIMK
ncbi:MAG: polysaccharide biosynthesis/export family protein [Bacteroidales bacterium]